MQRKFYRIGTWCALRQTALKHVYKIDSIHRKCIDRMKKRFFLQMKKKTHSHSDEEKEKKRFTRFKFFKEFFKRKK